MLLVIGSKKYSTWSLRPWLLMRYFGIEFEEELIPFEMRLGTREFTDDIKKRLKNASPNAKIPVLKTDGLVINESLAICEYVNDRCLGDAGWPQRQKDRYSAKSYALEMATGFINMRRLMPMSIGDKTSAAADPPVPAANDVRRVLMILETCLGNSSRKGEFLFGEFGVVDAFFAPVVLRFDTYRVKTSNAVAAYSRKILETGAMVEWCEAAKQEDVLIPDIGEIVDRYPTEIPSACKI